MKMMHMDKKYMVPVWIKPLLTLEEASALTGIGINKMRDITNEHDDLVLYNGSKRLIKREKLISYLLSIDYSI